MILLKNKAFIISMVLWCFITVVKILNHIPWYDEAHAWTIAEQLNLFQIVNFMKIEGHTILWYVLLMPFAKLHLWYPYSMQFLNWIFCFIALVIFWWKAPFNNILKALVTFSYPFLTTYSVYARCYSMGIMLLFLLTVLYKERLKNPILYSVILVLCANTSVMALVGATIFGLFFVYDFVKANFKSNTKDWLCPVCILLLGIFVIILQFIGVNDSAIDNYKGINLGDLEFFQKKVIGLVLLVLFSGTFIFTFKTKVRPLIFLFFTVCSLTYCFVYRFYGHYWNHAFYFIYLIIACWFGIDIKTHENVNSKNTVLNLLLSIIAIFQIFVPFYLHTSILKSIFDDDGIRFANVVLKDKTFENKTIILSNDTFAGFILNPYNKYKLKNYCEDKEFDYDVRNYPANNDICYQIKDENFNNAKKSFYYVTKLNMERLFSQIDEDEVYTNIVVGKALKKNKKLSIVDNESGYVYEIEKYKSFQSVNGSEYYIYRIKRHIQTVKQNG